MERNKNLLYFILSIISAFLIFSLDIFIPDGITVWLLYFFPIILVVAYVSWKQHASLILLISILVIVGFVINPEGVKPAAYALISRIMLIIIFWILSIILISRKKSIHDLLYKVQSHASEAEESRRTLEALMEYVPEGITIADAPDVKLKMVSRYGIETLGRTHTEMTAEEVVQRWEVFDTDGITPMPTENLPLVRAVKSGEVVRNMEVVQKNLKGDKLWLLCSAGPIFNAEGKITGGVVAWHDITERKRLEIEQQLLAEQRQLALDAAHLGWWHYDPITKISTWDDRYKEIFNVTGYKSPNDEILRRLHPEDLPKVWTVVEAALNPNDPKPYSAEYRIYHENGSIHWIEAHGTAIFEGEKNERHAVSFVGTVQDITEKKRADEALRESEQRFRTLADNISQLAWMADGNGWIFWYNERWYEYTGTTFNDMQGWGWKLVHHPDHLDQVLERWNKALKEALPWEDVFPLRSKNGNYGWFLSRALPIYDKDGNVTRWFGTNTDITEKKLQEQKLEQMLFDLQRTNNDLEQFAYSASHDLKEPIRMIKCYSQLIYKKYHQKLDNDAEEYFGYVFEGADRMNMLVNDLLKYSRINIQGNPFEIIDCNLLISEIINELRAIIHNENVLILYDGLPKIYGVKSQICQLFNNLIYNAIKFKSIKRPEIIIESEDRETEWLFKVRDNGIGIDPAYFEKVFTIFQRLNERDKYSGTGMGLALCKKIVEYHHGNIWVESGSGAGSIFNFTIAKPN